MFKQCFIVYSSSGYFYDIADPAQSLISHLVQLSGVPYVLVGYQFQVRTAKCNNSSKKDEIELFPGFKPAYEVTKIDWSDYKIEGVTYNETTVYQTIATVPGQTCLTSDHHSTASKISPVTNYKVIIYYW